MTGVDRLRPVHARLAGAIRHWSRYGDRAVDPPFETLTERAALLGLAAPGQVSANGSCRLLACADGWLAINLARADDRDLVPALLGEDEAGDPWHQLEAALPARPAAQLIERAALLGLALSRVGETTRPIAWTTAEGEGKAWPRRPKVVDLSALWAGPLCAAILAEAGCDVVKVESVRRPDTTAARSAAFDARLNGGKRRLAIDPAEDGDRARLAAMIARADIVVTSARRRGLASLGIGDALAAMSGCWIEITAHADPDRIGFGDDCAAAAGLIERREDGPRFLGDAIADPLTGLAAAATALRALATSARGHRRLDLAGVARAAAADRRRILR